MSKVHRFADKTIEIDDRNVMAIVRESSSPEGIGGILRAEHFDFDRIMVQKQYLQQALQELGEDEWKVVIELCAAEDTLRISSADKKTRIYIAPLIGGTS